MWTLLVVIVGPVCNLYPGMIEAEEQALVEQLVPHPTIEALTKAVLHGFARRDEVPGNAVLLCPGEHGVRRELGAIVRDDHPGLAALVDQRREFARHPAVPGSMCRGPLPDIPA